MNMQFSDKLTELRKKAGYSQEDLADKIGVSRQAVSKWERGESSPDTDNLIELATLYGVSLDELVTGKIVRTERGENDGKDFSYSDDGYTVSLGKDDISVSDGEGCERKYDKAAWENKRAKEKKVNRIVTSVFSLVAVITYLILGFCLKGGRGWSGFWVLFILIPVVSSFVEFAFYKRVAAINFPCIIVVVYASIGMFFSVWHPTWVMFVSIPIFYIVAGAIDRATGKRDNEAIEDAYREKKGKENKF